MTMEMAVDIGTVLIRDIINIIQLQMDLTELGFTQGNKQVVLS